MRMVVEKPDKRLHSFIDFKEFLMPNVFSELATHTRNKMIIFTSGLLQDFRPFFQVNFVYSRKEAKWLMFTKMKVLSSKMFLHWRSCVIENRCKANNNNDYAFDWKVYRYITFAKKFWKCLFLLRIEFLNLECRALPKNNSNYSSWASNQKHYQVLW